MFQICRKKPFAVAILLTAVLMGSISAQTVASNIQSMHGWQSCSVCAGARGAGAPASHYLQQGVSSPSLSGHSARAHLSATKPFAGALWWKQLGAKDARAHFIYNLFFYLKTPRASQALEFDVNQSNGRKKFIFGTQCNIAAGGVWDVYDPAGHAWRSTGVHCGISAFKWHHLTWEVFRDSSRVHYVSVTLDGAKHFINRSYNARSSSVHEINVAFQMDATRSHPAYDTWLDSMSLKSW